MYIFSFFLLHCLRKPINPIFITHINEPYSKENRAEHSNEKNSLKTMLYDIDDDDE